MPDLPPIVLGICRHRPERRRGTAGGHHDALEHGLPSAFGGDRDHHPGHHGRGGRIGDRRRMGRRPGALRAGRHAGCRIQDRSAGQPREHRRDCGGRLRLSRRCRWCSIPCSPRAAATSWPPKKWSPRCANCWYRRPPYSRPTAWRRGGWQLKKTEEGEELELAECARRIVSTWVRVRADHRHAREHAASRQYAVRPERRGAQRFLAAACRVRITGPAARSPRPLPPRSPTAWKCSEAVKDAQEYTWQALKRGIPTRHGAAHPGPSVLGARRGAIRRRK